MTQRTFIGFAQAFLGLTEREARGLYIYARGDGDVALTFFVEGIMS